MKLKGDFKRFVQHFVPTVGVSSESVSVACWPLNWKPFLSALQGCRPACWHWAAGSEVILRLTWWILHENSELWERFLPCRNFSLIVSPPSCLHLFVFVLSLCLLCLSTMSLHYFPLNWHIYLFPSRCKISPELSHNFSYVLVMWVLI